MVSIAEAIEDYKPGGFHPVHLGDVFNDRYAVEHKLGYGGSSVVWLARDLLTSSCVALKILRADATVEMQQSDLMFLRHLNTAASPQSGWRSYLPAFFRQNASLFPRIIQDFMIHGPNGDHLCVVMEALGASLDMMLEFADDGGPRRARLPLAARMTVAFQIAKGVAHLHDKGIVHGDLHPNNILFVLPGIESWTPDEVIAYLGKPIRWEEEPVDGEGGAPRYIVRSPRDSVFWDLCIEKPDMPAIKIADFGLSFFSQPEGVNKGLGTPLPYAAPEVIFNDPLKTPACDVWSLGCLLYRVLGRLGLWRMAWSQAEIFPNLMTALGRFPDRWWQQWDGEERSKYFDDEGRPVPGIHNWGGPIDRRVNESTEELKANVKELGENEISPVHLDELKHILLAIFEWEPEERVDAKAVFQAVSWMQGYAEECVEVSKRTGGRS